MEFMHIFDLLIGIYGLNFLYQWYRGKVQGKTVNPQCLLATDLTMETCRDAAGLTAFLLPRVLGFGLALVVYAAVSYSGVLGRLTFAFYTVFFLAVVLAYVLTNKQARRRFWS